MSKPYTTDETPPSGSLIAGMIEFKVEAAELTTSSSGKTMAKVHVISTEKNEPGYDGKHLYENYTIGRDGDELAEDPLTFGKKATFGFKLLRDLFNATRLNRTNDLEVDVPALKDKTFVASVTPEIDKQSQEPRSRMRTYFPVGKPLYVRTVDPETGKMGPVQGAGANGAAPQATAAPTATASAPPPPPPPANP